MASFVKPEPVESPVTTSDVSSTSLGLWQRSPSSSDTEEENIVFKFRSKNCTKKEKVMTTTLSKNLPKEGDAGGHAG